jgi:hypothetical protein
MPLALGVWAGAKFHVDHHEVKVLSVPQPKECIIIEANGHKAVLNAVNPVEVFPNVFMYVGIGDPKPEWLTNPSLGPWGQVIIRAPQAVRIIRDKVRRRG